MLMTCNTLWIGERLGRVERACLRSVMRQGHPLTLYSYDQVEGVPEGVEVRDASEIMPKEKIIRHKSGSVSLFSNLFRYELQRQSRGLWLDADEYLVAPIAFDRPYIYGLEDEKGHIGTCVLYLPPDSPIIQPLIDLFKEASVPEWLPPLHYWRARIRLGWTGRSGLSKMPWGSAGPKALTAVTRAYNLESWALPKEVFSPVHYQDAAWLRDPERKLDDMLNPSSVGIHLWNNIIKQWKEQPAPAGSFLDRLHQEGA